MSLINDQGGQRTATQVLANSALATILSMAYFFGIGEDSHVWFNAALFESADEYKYQQHMAGVIWYVLCHLFCLVVSFTMDMHTLLNTCRCMYIAHYACAAGDTWASEVGILASSRPRLVTTLFMRAVPPGTNGGMSILGTTASALGGLFIGFSFYVMSLLMGESAPASQFPMVPLGLVCGLLGSIIDSLLGGTVQVTYYSHKKRKVVITLDTQDPSIEHVCGCDLLSNESVNAVSIAVTMLCAALAGPFVFCLCDSNTQC